VTSRSPRGSENVLLNDNDDGENDFEDQEENFFEEEGN
jgi:hypothetical protein